MIVLHEVVLSCLLVRYGRVFEKNGQGEKK